ncbi:MAG: hypothetical protein L3J71_17925 [Victivallaceae bacterium]|nr:hypothetical protein [Victivallaceae bacterium]
MQDVESVKSIRQQISKLGSMLPGKINTQWTQCKTKGCRCMDKKNPRKHGPYNQLSFSFAGKSSTMNIKEKDLKKAQKCTDNYKAFQALSKELVLANIKEIRQGGFKKKK